MGEKGGREGVVRREGGGERENESFVTTTHFRLIS